MRAIFGLVGVLGFLVAAVIVMNTYLSHTQVVLKAGGDAREQAEQIAGIDTNAGGRVSDNVKLESYAVGGKLRGLKVISITPGSSYQTHYGIQPNDIITRIGPQTVRDIDDGGMAIALAYEAYQRQWDLEVQRGNQTLTLPQQKSAMPVVPATPTNATPQAPGQQTAQQPGQQPAQPAQPAKPQEPYRSPLYRQLDAIQNAGQ